VSRCLSDAVTAGQADKSARGKVTLEFVVSPGGKARGVKVQQSSVKNKTVEDCVVAKVEEIGFPEVPKDVEYSYTYGFESN
jgi:TonB family protein